MCVCLCVSLNRGYIKLKKYKTRIKAKKSFLKLFRKFVLEQVIVIHVFYVGYVACNMCIKGLLKNRVKKNFEEIKYK